MSGENERAGQTILPPSRSALEEGLDRIFGRFLDRIVPPFPDLMDPTATPADFLPYLAADRGTPEWSSDDSEQRKRDTVAATWPTHRLAGTRKALTLALEALDVIPGVTPWHEQSPPGEPYSLILDGELTEQHDAKREARLEARLQSAKAERDTLTLRLYRNTVAPIWIGSAVASSDTADLIYPQRYLTDFVPRERQMGRLHILMNQTLPEAMNGE
ncbi:phage tail protein I [Pseudomonas alloputida]|uniref:phage tail protein I n=1 Tax=Pseudomonas alloputida TaxID=1940621 RepID=UPI001E2DA8F6|nr:phage tail protein I [Pseudomonas alloputida]MCE0871055.1 phage tail protein I [Pseudomonas alloputida]